jgi:polar amino acid transport system ATP-binding protein
MKLEVIGVTKAFGEHRALGGVDLAIGGAAAVVLIGPSGGGKSTLLRLIAGLDHPDSGSIRLDGEPLPDDEKRLREHRRRVGTVFQSFNLFPHLTGLENITLPLEAVHGLDRAGARDRAMELLRRFRLEEHAAKRPGQLSGGQRQRIAIARAVSIRPKLLLLDEPTSALDPEMTAEVLDMIAELKTEGRQFVLVTHQMGFARSVADHAVFLADGTVVESGPSGALFGSPNDPRTASFLDRVLRY